MMCGSVYTSFSSIRAATAANAASAATMAAATAAQEALVEQTNAVRGFVATGDESFLPRLKSFREDFNKAAADLGERVGESTSKTWVAALKTEAATVAAEQDQQVALRRNPSTMAEAQASLQTRGRLTKSRELLKNIMDAQRAVQAERDRKST